MIKQLLKLKIDRFLRRFYWLLNFYNIPKGSGFVHFPLIVEGKGKCTFGNNYKVEKNVELGFGKHSISVFGDNMNFKNDVIFRVSENQKVTIGNNSSIGRFTEIYVNNTWQIEDNVIIASNCAIFSREKGFKGKLTIGKGTHIGDFSILDLCDDLVIEEEVALGPRTTVYTHDHQYDLKNVAAWKGGVKTKPVVIKKGAWIGANVTILPGVTIGEYAVVATGAVVTKDVESNSIYGGIPAKKIKDI